MQTIKGTPFRWPNNVRAVVVILDKSDTNVIPEIIRRTKNEQALSGIAAWRRSDLKYALIAGALSDRKSGALVALSGNTEHLKKALKYAFYRLEELAATDYMSVWMLLVADDDVQNELRGLLASLQTTVGSA